MATVGDRCGNAVYVKNPFGDGHVWLNIESGQIAPSNDIVKRCNDFQQKANVIKLFRYIRPFDNRGQSIDNLRGLTFYIELDYVAKQISFSYARCEGDNFDKASGRIIAHKKFVAGECYTINMPDGKIPKNGVMSTIFNFFTNRSYCTYNKLLIKENMAVLNQFYDAFYH